MVMTYYRDKLAWKLFDVRTLKDTFNGMKNTFGKGNGFQANNKPGRFSPIKAQEQANMSMLPEPEQPAQPAYQPVKQADYITMPNWLAPVGAAAAGIGTGLLTGAALTPVNKPVGLVAGALAGLGAATMVYPWLTPADKGAPEEAALIPEANIEAQEYLANAALGAGLGGMAGAGMGYLIGDSAGVVPGMALGAGLGGYAGYRTAGYLYDS